MPGSRPDPLPPAWRARVLLGYLTGVDARLDLPRLRLLVEEAVTEEADLNPFFLALAANDPFALVEIVAGPRAVPGPAVLQGALAVLDALEKVMAPVGLYRRLLALAGPRGPQVLAVAATRHPTASWMVALSDLVPEADHPGLTHLLEAARTPAFAAVCWAHASAGHHLALEEAGTVLGRAEPVGALLSVGVIHAARRAAARVLDAAPDAPVVPWVAAVWGPDLDAFFVGVVPLLRSSEGVASLDACAGAWPRTRVSLGALPVRSLPRSVT